MRLIDADSIPFREYLGDDEPRVYKSEIDALPTIDPVKWIPVGERLPEKETSVLIACKNGAVFVAEYKGTDYELQKIWSVKGPLGTGRRVASSRVTRWMPLPELREWTADEV